jgi:hypothetical protein
LFKSLLFIPIRLDHFASQHLYFFVLLLRFSRLLRYRRALTVSLLLHELWLLTRFRFCRGLAILGSFPKFLVVQLLLFSLFLFLAFIYTSPADPDDGKYCGSHGGNRDQPSGVRLVTHLKGEIFCSKNQHAFIEGC